MKGSEASNVRSSLEEGTRARLLSAARDLYLESGPNHFSLREVARRVGVSAAAVYRHFDGKEALTEAACTQGFEVFAGYLIRALRAPTPRARLIETGEQYRAFAVENPLDYRFIFMSMPKNSGGPLCDEPSARPQDATFRMLVDRVKECMSEGVLKKGNPDEVAVLIWAHVHGLVSLRLSGHMKPVGSDEAFARFYHHAVSKLLDGLGP